MVKRLLIILVMLTSASAVCAQTLSQSYAERMERGVTVYNNNFVSKGQWAAGGSGSYSTHSNEDYNLIVVDKINSMGYNVSASSMFAYAFADNHSVGARISYNRNLLKVDSSSLIFGDENDGGINLSFNDSYMLTHSYSLMSILRQYIPLGNSKRFALFNEVQLALGGAQSKFTYDSPVQGTFSTTKSIGLNFAPGITAFISNQVAVEINVGAMGLSYAHTDQVHNQVETGNAKSKMFNFKINVLSLGLGLTYYL